MVLVISKSDSLVRPDAIKQLERLYHYPELFDPRGAGQCEGEVWIFQAGLGDWRMGGLWHGSR